MIGTLRMQNLRSECERVMAEGFRRLVETGVWRGGTAIMMRAVLAAYGITDRRVFANSFEGFPAQSEADSNFTVGGVPPILRSRSTR